MTSPPSTLDWFTALRESQRRLSDLVAPLTGEAVEAPSYDSEWSIAQVLSHLGSGAVIFALFVQAGTSGSPAPGMEEIQPIWDEWNAKTPSDQAKDGLSADAAFLGLLEELDEDAREKWELEMFGGHQRIADVARLRLGEHVLHTWDVAVALDPAATLSPAGVDLLIDPLGQLAARAGKAPDEPVDVSITTTDPTHSLRLTAGADGVSLAAAGSDVATGSGGAHLELPAEALIRLVYGRLDPDHTPPLKADGIDLDLLRRMFPGV